MGYLGKPFHSCRLILYPSPSNYHRQVAFLVLDFPTMKQPFSISPNPLLLYLTPALNITMEKVRFVLDSRQGLTAILGDVGLGKSTVVRYLFNEYDSRTDVAATMIASPNFPSPFAFLKKICADFDVPAKRSLSAQEESLKGFLIELYRDDKLCVIFVDEAQRLPGPQLELVRTLLNFETDDTKLIQVVLSGQLELRQKLMDPTKKAIRSRIFAPSHLAALSLSETEDMLNFRCARAEVPIPFTRESYEAIYTLSGGVPRDILKVAAVAYRFAGGASITPELCASAAKEALLAEEEYEHALA
jgi:general secretion pathway protein A